MSPHHKPSTNPAGYTRYLLLDREQAAAVLSAAAEMGIVLFPPPADLGDGSRLVADLDLAAIEALREGFVESLRFPVSIGI